jgi:hypothetical protein
VYESTHPMTARRSRPRRWPLFLPFGLVVVLAAVWSGAWFFASAKAQTTFAGWREREAKAGRICRCEKETIGGYPFRIEVRCTEPLAELRSPQPPIALKAKDLLGAVQVYDPTLMIGELAGPLTIGEPGKPPNYVANWKLGQASVRGTPKAPERVSVVFDEPVIERPGETGNAAHVFKARRVELHGRVKAGTPADHPVIDLALLLMAASMPGLHPAAETPMDAEIVASLRGLKDLAPKPWPERLRELQAANGTIEITKARVQQEDVIAVASGSLGLSPRGNLDGRLQVTIVQLEKALKKLDLDRLLSEGQAGSTLSALDQIIPGLGSIARQNAPSLIASIGQRTTLEGKPAVTLPLRFVDGTVFLGMVPVGRLRPLY